MVEIEKKKIKKKKENSLVKNNSTPENTVIRDNKGRFVKGAPSPNPGGRSCVSKDLSLFIRKHLEPHTLNGNTHLVFDKMVKYINDESNWLDTGQHPFLQYCIKTLLAYAYGTPAQQIQFKDKDGNDADPTMIQKIIIGDKVIVF